MRRVSLWIASLMVLIIVLSGCSSKPESKTTTLKIGFQGPLTGNVAVIGIPMANAVRLAIEQAHAELLEKGIDLQYAPGDDQVDPAQAPTVARKMIDDPAVIAMVGPIWGSDAIAAAPLYTEANMAMLSFGTAAELTSHGWTFYRLIPQDDLQGATVASYLAKVLGVRRVAVIDDGTSYGSGLAKATVKTAKDLGLEIVVEEAFDPKADDWSPTVSKIVAEDAEAVFVGGSFAEVAALNRQMMDKGYDGFFFAPDGCLSPDYVPQAGSASEGTLFTSQAAPTPDYGGPSTGPLADFVKEYTAKFGEAPQAYAAEAYDAANLIIEAIKAGNTDRASTGEYISSNTIKGITKDFTFSPTGEPEGDTINIYQIKDGKIQWLGSSKDLIH